MSWTFSLVCQADDREFTIDIANGPIETLAYARLIPIVALFTDGILYSCQLEKISNSVYKIASLDIIRLFKLFFVKLNIEKRQLPVVNFLSTDDIIPFVPLYGVFTDGYQILEKIEVEQNNTNRCLTVYESSKKY